MISARYAAVLFFALSVALLSGQLITQAQEAPPVNPIPNPFQAQRAGGEPPVPGVLPDIDDLPGQPPRQPQNRSQPSAERDLNKRLPAFFQVEPIQDAAAHDELQKLKNARYNAVVAELRARVASYQGGVASFETIADAARRLIKASPELALTPEQRIALLTQQVDLLKQVESQSEQKLQSGHGTIQDLYQARYLRLDAEIDLLTFQRSLQAEPAK